MAQVQHHPHPNQNQQISGWTGWIGFASIFMAISGFFHIMFGIGALFSQTWYAYTSGQAYLLDTTSWGWAMILTGILLGITSIMLMSGNMLGRIAGGIVATIGILVNLALLPVAPIWAIIAIVVSVMVLYAIIAHGDEMKRYAEKHPVY